MVEAQTFFVFLMLTTIFVGVIGEDDPVIVLAIYDKDHSGTITRPELEVRNRVFQSHP